MNSSLNVAGIIASRSSLYTALFPVSSHNNPNIPIGRIIYCKAEEEITHFYLDDYAPKEIKIFRSIKACEASLHSYAFFRVHKTYMVNLSYVKSITPKNSNYEILLVNGERVPLSRRRRKGFMEYVEEMGYLPFMES